MSRVSYDGGETFKKFRKPEDVTTKDVRMFLKWFQDWKTKVPNPLHKHDHDEDPETEFDVRRELVRIMSESPGNVIRLCDWSADGKSISIPAGAVRSLLVRCGDIDFICDIRFMGTWTVVAKPLDPVYTVMHNIGRRTFVTIEPGDLI